MVMKVHPLHRIFEADSSNPCLPLVQCRQSEWCVGCWVPSPNAFDCRMSIHLSALATVTLENALHIGDLPQILISADSPHPIHMASERFIKELDLSRSQILGRSLDAIFPAESDVWCHVLGAALQGYAVPWTLKHSCSLIDAVVFTVVDSPHGRVRYLLIRLLLRGANTTGVSNVDSASERAQSDTSSCACSKTAIRALSEQMCSDSPPISVSPNSCPKSSSERGHPIFPRGRAGSRRSPVVITSDVIQKLRSLPLQEAARAVGVSATAFKHACRRLGLRRWAYKRRPAPETRSAMAASACGTDSDGCDSCEGCSRAAVRNISTSPAGQELVPVDAFPPFAQSDTCVPGLDLAMRGSSLAVSAAVHCWEPAPTSPDVAWDEAADTALGGGWEGPPMFSLLLDDMASFQR